MCITPTDSQTTSTVGSECTHGLSYHMPPCEIHSTTNVIHSELDYSVIGAPRAVTDTTLSQFSYSHTRSWISLAITCADYSGHDSSVTTTVTAHPLRWSTELGYTILNRYEQSILYCHHRYDIQSILLLMHRGMLLNSLLQLFSRVITLGPAPHVASTLSRQYPHGAEQLPSSS